MRWYILYQVVITTGAEWQDKNVKFFQKEPCEQHLMGGGTVGKTINDVE